MKFSIAIETKDRRLTGGENYLQQTLDNLYRAGVLDSPMLSRLSISVGGEKDKDFLNPILGDCKFLKVALNCWGDNPSRQQNAQRAIAMGAAVDADWVLKLEDDLDFVDDFLDTVARFLADYGEMNVPMFCLGTTFERVSDAHFQPGETFLGPGTSFPRVRAFHAAGKRVVSTSCLGWYGAQALLWKRETAAELANWLGPDPYLFDGKTKHRNRGHDLLLQGWGVNWASRRGIHHPSFAATIPSFVQHVGRKSNLDQPEIGHTQPFFEFPWPGREWRYRGIQA